MKRKQIFTVQLLPRSFPNHSDYKLMPVEGQMLIDDSLPSNLKVLFTSVSMFKHPDDWNEQSAIEFFLSPKQKQA